VNTNPAAPEQLPTQFLPKAAVEVELSGWLDRRAAQIAGIRSCAAEQQTLALGRRQQIL
jgi:hypothetical protein